MSVFAGGADLAALHAVCGEPGTSPSGTLDRVAALVDKSMVVAVEHAGVTRYRMLETLRAYAREQRDDGTDRRHAEYFVGLAEAAARGVQGVDERAWIEATLPNVDNLRAAFELAFAERDVDLALRLVAALPELTHVRGMYEADEWAQRSLDLADPGHPLFAAAVGTAARGAWGVGDFARADALAALAAGCHLGAGAGRSGHPADVAADVALYRGDVAAAEAHYTSEVERARREGDRDPAGVDAVLRRDLPGRAPGARGGGGRGAGGAGGGPRDRQPDARSRWATTRWVSSSRSRTPTRRWPSWTRRRGSRRKCRTSGGRASR